MIKVCIACQKRFNEFYFEQEDKHNKVRNFLLFKHHNAMRVCCDDGVLSVAIALGITPLPENFSQWEANVAYKRKLHILDTRNRLLEEQVAMMKEQLEDVKSRLEVQETKAVDANDDLQELSKECEKLEDKCTKAKERYEDLAYKLDNLKNRVKNIGMPTDGM